MKLQHSALLALAASAVAAPPSLPVREVAPRKAAAACTSAVTLDASTNVFKKYKLHAHPFYRQEVATAVKAISDSRLAASAAKVADVGSFLWM